METDKKTFRKQMMAKLARLTDEERHATSAALQTALFQTELWQNAGTIGIYLSMGNEWDTWAIVAEAFKAGKQVVVPKTVPKTKTLVFFQITDENQTEKGNFGLTEPIVEATIPVEKNEIDLLIVPGLIFTKEGYRIGFGGGYYDRYLANFIHTTVSLASNRQVVESFPIESFDIPVNYLITEVGIVQ